MISVPSDKFKKNYDKIFPDKTKQFYTEGIKEFVPVPIYGKFDDLHKERMKHMSELMGELSKHMFDGASASGWKFRYSDFDELPIPMPRPRYDPYLPVAGEQWSNEFNSEKNQRIMRIIKQAREGGLSFDISQYRIVFNQVGDSPGLSISELALRGLFTSPQFIKTFFAKNMLGKPFNVAKFHADLFNCETVEGMIGYLEDFLIEKKPKLMIGDDYEADDMQWSEEELKKIGRLVNGDK